MWKMRCAGVRSSDQRLLKSVTAGCPCLGRRTRVICRFLVIAVIFLWTGLQEAHVAGRDRPRKVNFELIGGVAAAKSLPGTDKSAVEPVKLQKIEAAIRMV